MAVNKETDASAAKTEEVESATNEKKVFKKAVSAGDSDGFCVYLGPNIRGVIQSGTIFNEPREKVITSLSAAVEKYPLIAELIIPGESLANDRIKVKTPGNLLYVNYKKLAARLSN